MSEAALNEVEDDAELICDDPQARRRVHVEAETGWLCAGCPDCGGLEGLDKGRLDRRCQMTIYVICIARRI